MAWITSGEGSMVGYSHCLSGGAKFGLWLHGDRSCNGWLRSPVLVLALHPFLRAISGSCLILHWAVLAHWAGKNLTWQQKEKIGSCQQSQGSFRGGGETVQVGLQGCSGGRLLSEGSWTGPVVPWNLSHVGKVTSPRPSAIRRERWAPAGACLSLRWLKVPRDSRCLHWWIVAAPSLFPIAVYLTSCPPSADSEMITVKKSLPVNTISQFTDSKLACYSAHRCVQSLLIPASHTALAGNRAVQGLAVLRPVNPTLILFPL